MNLSSKWIAYAEAVGAGAVVAGLAAAYQAVQQAGSIHDWTPVASAFLVGAMGYLLAALRWLNEPPPPPAPPTEPVVVQVAPTPTASPPATTSTTAGVRVAIAQPEHVEAPEPPAPGT